MRQSAGAVIFRRDADRILYLLLHYPSGHWDLVKGRIERGETLRETVIREAEEETGIQDLRFVSKFRETIYYDFVRNGRTVHKRVVFFLAESATEKVVLSHEHTGHVWLEFGDAVKRTTYDNARRILELANLRVVDALKN